jgi:hypothetical protein
MGTTSISGMELDIIMHPDPITRSNVATTVDLRIFSMLDLLPVRHDWAMAAAP